MYLGAFESFIAYDEGRNSEAWCFRPKFGCLNRVLVYQFCVVRPVQGISRF